MNSAHLTRGPYSGESVKILAISLIVVSILHLWKGFSEWNWLTIFLGSSFFASGAIHARVWMRFWKGVWRIEWKSQHIRIIDSDQVVYNNNIQDIPKITQDGRGFTIFLTNGSTYRILKNNLNAELECLLDKAGAEQADVDKRASSLSNP